MNQEMEESRQPTILGRPRTRPLNPEQELMQSVIDANAPPRIPPVEQPRHVSAGSAARHKDKYLAMRERYERTNLLYSQYKDTLSLAEIKQRELQEEIDLLLEGLIEAIDKGHTSVTIPPLMEPPLEHHEPRPEYYDPPSDSEDPYLPPSHPSRYPPPPAMYEDHPGNGHGPTNGGSNRRRSRNLSVSDADRPYT